MNGRVLIIAGSDPSGGAGLQADIKTVTALGGYAATAVTALTVQNTKGVSAVYPTPPQVIAAQIEAVLGDIGADAIKIGMIGEAGAARAIVEQIKPHAEKTPIVLDPVLAATSGDALAFDGVLSVLLDELTPLATLVTPNLDEARTLTGVDAVDEETMIAAGKALIERGAGAALVKGGHGRGDAVSDVLVTKDGARVFSNPRIETTSTHGTGCTLASAVAAGLAQGLVMQAAVKRAIDYVQMAIKTAPGFGKGCGPLNHGHTVHRKT